MSYYIYFITPEPESRFIKFGKSESLGNRWYAYRTAMPDAKVVGLIECQNKTAMNTLESHVKYNTLKVYHVRGEWLYHTEEVKAFYQERTNINIKETLQQAIEEETRKRTKPLSPEQKARKREREKERLQHPDVKVHRRNYEKTRQKCPERKAGQSRYQQRPDVKKRRQEYDKMRDSHPERKARKREYDKIRDQRPERKARRNEQARLRRQRAKQEKSNGQLTFLE